jgi:hypothetical protein
VVEKLNKEMEYQCLFPKTTHQHLSSTNLFVWFGLPGSARVELVSILELSALSISPTCKPLRKSIRGRVNLGFQA